MKDFKLGIQDTNADGRTFQSNEINASKQWLASEKNKWRQINTMCPNGGMPAKIVVHFQEHNQSLFFSLCSFTLLMKRLQYQNIPAANKIIITSVENVRLCLCLYFCWRMDVSSIRITFSIIQKQTHTRFAIVVVVFVVSLLGFFFHHHRSHHVGCAEKKRAEHVCVFCVVMLDMILF